ncbi:hypothetical protein [Streptomyces sp. NPDC001851]|uniref:hypothetical protein n=1 Tax=Streptomyces sp. NPDC001851 TaxID=3154529 RepID=UPI003317F462
MIRHRTGDRQRGRETGPPPGGRRESDGGADGDAALPRAVAAGDAAAMAAPAGTTVFAVWSAGRLDSYRDPDRRVPVVAPAPLPDSAVTGGSRYSPSAELDRTAVRPWWPRRLARLVLPTVLGLSDNSSRLPASGCVSAVYRGGHGVQGSAPTVWAWPMQPGVERGAWAAAPGAFAPGAARYAVRGARPGGPG